MRIRFFGSSECRDCLKIFIILNKLQINYEYIDGHDKSDEVQDFCDEQEVDELPHLQFLDDEDNIVDEHVGSLSEEGMKIYLAEHFPNY